MCKVSGVSMNGVISLEALILLTLIVGASLLVATSVNDIQIHSSKQGVLKCYYECGGVESSIKPKNCKYTCNEIVKIVKED